MDVSRRSALKLAGTATAVVGVAAVAPGLGAASAVAATPAARTALAATRLPSPPAPAASSAAVAKAKAMVKRMTLDEKISMLHGGGGQAAIPRLGIPGLNMNDGPSGVGNSTGVTQFPDSKTLAATWDPAAAEQFGAAYGAEQRGKGHNVALGPCINILRQPYWGRSYETYTEDPYLNGVIAAATIRGIQSQHVISMVKHFAANNQETLRESIDVVVGQRALQELYFPGFKAAVDDGRVGAIMTSYNKVNGTWASENRGIVQDVIRDTWQFDGMVCSDWGGTHSTVETAKAGSDVEMPSDTYLGAALKAAVTSGAVSQDTVDEMVTHVLTAMYRVGLFDYPLPSSPAAVVTSDQHLALARKLSVEGTVLLKNDHVLPFSKPRSIAVIGDAAYTNPQTHGYGSGLVNASAPVVTVLDGIKARAGSATVTYAQGTLGINPLPAVPASAFGSGLTATYYASTDLSGTPLGTETVANLDWDTTPSLVAGEQDGWSARYTGTFTAATAGGYRFSLTSGGTTTVSIDDQVVMVYKVWKELVYNALVDLTAGAHKIEVVYVPFVRVSGPPTPASGVHLGVQANYEDLIAAAAAAAKSAEVAVVVVADRTSEAMDRSSLSLPADQDALVAAVTKANRRTVVVLATSGAVLMPWVSTAGAVLANWFAGQEQGTIVASLLFGDSEPGGRLTETFPAAEGQGPYKTSVEFPGDGTQVYYDEELAIGYRWFNQSGEQPLFAFGHGLSYTTFKLADLRIDRCRDGSFDASVTIRNTGGRSGSEVVQLYLDAPADAKEPAPQLKAFAKVTLPPGEKKRVTLNVGRQALAVWLNPSTGWTVVPGRYHVSVGTSFANRPLEATLAVQ